jgi:hypothetical protein
LRYRRRTPSLEADADDIEEIEQDIKPPRGRLTQILVAVLIATAAVSLFLARVMGDQRQEAQTAQATAVAQVTALADDVRTITVTVLAPQPQPPDVRPTAPFSLPERPRDFGRANLAGTRSIQVAYVALGQLDIDPELSLLIALEANKLAHTPEAEDALRRALAASHVRLRLQFPGEMIQSAEFAPSGNAILTFATAGPLRVWDAHTGKPLWALDHPRRVLSAHYSPDGRFIMTTSADKIARLWDASRGDLLKTYVGHTADVTASSFSSDARHVVTGGRDGTVRIWSTEGFSSPVVLSGSLSVVDHVEWSAGDRRILASSEEGLCVWDADTRKVLFKLANTPAAKSILDAHFSPDGRVVVVTGAAFVRLLDSVTGLTVRTLEGTYADYASFSQDRSRLLTGGLLWDVGSWQVVARFHNAFGFPVRFSSTGRYLVTQDGDAFTPIRLNVWDVGSEQWPPPLLATFKMDVTHRAAFFSPYDETLASVDADGAVRVWDVVAGDELPTAYADLLALARTRVTRQLTCAEQRAYVNENSLCATGTP